jgi:hypothetical protein
MPVPSANLAEAVALACPPGAKFKLDPETYEGLTMLDDTPKPTLAEIEAAWEARPADPPPPLTVPGAAFLQAIGRTLEIALKAKINEIPNLDTRRHMMLYLDYPYFVSNHPVIAQIAATMGKTDAEIYAYFEAAHAIAYPSGQ